MQSRMHKTADGGGCILEQSDQCLVASTLMPDRSPHVFVSFGALPSKVRNRRHALAPVDWMPILHPAASLHPHLCTPQVPHLAPPPPKRSLKHPASSRRKLYAANEDAKGKAKAAKEDAKDAAGDALDKTQRAMSGELKQEDKLVQACTSEPFLTFPKRLRQ